MTEPATGGALIARTLATLGVKDVFALHGGHLDAFLVACPDEGIRLTDFRHEASAGHAADAYARSSDTGFGVCVVTAGPGFTNALTPMTSAWVDAVPVVFIVGSPPLREVETNPLQGGIDQIAMAAPVTKWAHRVTGVERLPDLIEKAARIAVSGRPGPVLLDDGIAFEDIDGAGFDGGQIRIFYTAGAHAEDQLSILASGPVTVVGSEVRVGGTAIGTIDGTEDGVDGAALVIARRW